jgi:hypothetical protein
MDLGEDDDDDALALESLESSGPDSPSSAAAPPTTTVSTASLPILNSSFAASGSPRTSSDIQSPPTSPKTRALRSDTEDSRSTASGGGKGRLVYAMEGFRDKLRSLRRSRTSLPLAEGEGR